MKKVKYRVINCKILTIRKKPSKESKAVGYLKHGQTVNIIKGKSKKVNGTTWRKCSKGYISGKYLQKITPNYLKRVQKNADIVYNAIVEIHCKHKGGALSWADIKKKKVTTCSSAVSAVLQESGVLKKGTLISHTPAGNKHDSIKSVIIGKDNLISGTYKICKVNKTFKNLDPEYQEKGIVYVYDSNIAISAGNNYIYSCNNGTSQLKEGRYIKDKMNSGYCFTQKILYVIIPRQ